MYNLGGHILSEEACMTAQPAIAQLVSAVAKEVSDGAFGNASQQAMEAELCSKRTKDE